MYVCQYRMKKKKGVELGNFLSFVIVAVLFFVPCVLAFISYYFHVKTFIICSQNPLQFSLSELPWLGNHVI